MIDRDRLVKTFCDIASIDSPSGEEEEMAVDLVRRLEALDLTVTRDDYGNVIASDGREDEQPAAAVGPYGHGRARKGHQAAGRGRPDRDRRDHDPRGRLQGGALQRFWRPWRP